MSFWRRFFGPSEPPPPEDEQPEPPEEKEEPASDDPEYRLSQLGEGVSVLDEEDVLALVDRLCDQGREARAIDLLRRILLHHPDRLRVHQRVAEMLASRGDDEGADGVLAPFLARADAPLELWMLAAEIAERRHDRVRALALYERVVARDLDYPRARARVRRLREGAERRDDIGATLMADGALARGRYRVERELGRGGAGTVFLADDLSLGRKVALKVYHRRGRAERTRLLSEARTPAKLEHPGIVRIFDLDETLAAIAMERVLGGSVRQELNKGALPIARIRRWFVTAAEVLVYVHEASIVHRDLKPSNMLLRADDRVVLTDFGLACPVRARGPEGKPAEGTLVYMPSEQRAGAPADPAMDIYALGISMKEVLDHATSAPPDIMVELAAACTRSDAKQRPSAQLIAERLRTA